MTDVKEIKTFEEMAKGEEKLAKEIDKLAGSVRSYGIKLLLEVMALDSRRHAKFYGTLADILEPGRRMISPADLSRIQEKIEYHIKEEAYHMNEVKKMADSTDNPKVKMILNIILKDEIRHHSIFQALKDEVIVKETLIEEDLWNRMYDPSIWKQDQL
jgi:rubrerythrin